METVLADTIQNALERKEIVYLSSETVDINFQTKIVEYHDDYIIINNCVPSDLITRFVISPKYILKINLIRLEILKLEPHGECIKLYMEKSATNQETRASERFSFSAEEHVVCEFTNPLDSLTNLRKVVLDMSAGGVSFSTSSFSKLFEPGVQLVDFRVYIDDQLYKESPAEIVYARKFMDIKKNLKKQVGIKFIDPS